MGREAILSTLKPYGSNGSRSLRLRSGFGLYPTPLQPKIRPNGLTLFPLARVSWKHVTSRGALGYIVVETSMAVFRSPKEQ